MLAIAVDGACRRNGKPDCVSAGGVFVLHLDEVLDITHTATLTNYELQSTNQRGELLGMLTALDYVLSAQQDAQIVTDSEYMYNAITKDWLSNWSRKGWVTATNDPVKNKDIWLEIQQSIKKCADANLDVTFYHIKGHAVSFGKVTAMNLLNSDPTGRALYNAVDERVRTVQLKEGMYDQIMELSRKNHGFELDNRTLRRFVVTNLVADSVATKCVEAADALMK